MNGWMNEWMNEWMMKWCKSLYEDEDEDEDECGKSYMYMKSMKKNKCSKVIMTVWKHTSSCHRATSS